MPKSSISASVLFQSTRPARGATLPDRFKTLNPLVSIHAPREGRDGDVLRGLKTVEVSIHAPREGRDGG